MVRRDAHRAVVVATMFEQYGGFSSVRRIVSAFYDAVMEVPDLARHFADTDMRSLIEHQTLFIAYLMGGPGAAYSDEVLQRVHSRLGITHDEFQRLLETLTETLEDHGVADDDVAAIASLFQDREHLIVASRARQDPA